MDQLDREIAEAFNEPVPAQGPGRILMVGGPRRLQSKVRAQLAERGHSCTCVQTLAESREALGATPVDLLLVDVDLPDGDGLDMVRALRGTAPAARAIVLSAAGSLDRAVEAMRCGAIDFLDTGVALDDLLDRVDAALKTCREDSRQEQRLAQLRVVCKKLVAAREEVSSHLDKLCQDLVSAYRDVSDQMNEVAVTTEFRTLLQQELDVEDLLRTALEYLLTKTGPTNAAVFLPDANQTFDLGAYVNYDCPRETITVLLNHLCRAVCPQMVDETEIVSFEDAAAFAAWAGADAGFLSGCEVLAMSCRHAGRCMAVMVLFRGKDEPYEESMAGTLDILRTIFAEQIANVVRVHHRARPSWPKDPLDDDGYDVTDYDEYGFGGGMAA